MLLLEVVVLAVPLVPARPPRTPLRPPSMQSQLTQSLVKLRYMSRAAHVVCGAHCGCIVRAKRYAL